MTVCFRTRLKELAAVRRRFGYRRLHLLLQREGMAVNHKKLYRIYREEKLVVRKRGGRKRAMGARAPLLLPSRRNERWSLDFVADALADGRRFRVLAIVDDFTRECLALVADIYHSGLGVTGSWYQLVAARFIHQGESFAVVATEDVTAVREARIAIGELSQRMLTLQEDERQRIAAELHDSTAQHLAAIGLNTMTLRARSGPDAETSKLWENVEASLQEAARELRAFTYLLHPTALESDGLNAALRRYVKGFAARTGVKVMLKLSGEIDELPVPLRQPMLRIVQEALANVHRHAGASRVSVKQKLIKNQVHMTISDNGSGISALRNNGKKQGFDLGVGIPSMRERLRAIGGRLEIKSGSHGTTVEVRVPLDKQQHNARRARP